MGLVVLALEGLIHRSPAERVPERPRRKRGLQAR